MTCPPGRDAFLLACILFGPWPWRVFSQHTAYSLQEFIFKPVNIFIEDTTQLLLVEAVFEQEIVSSLILLTGASPARVSLAIFLVMAGYDLCKRMCQSW